MRLDFGNGIIAGGTSRDAVRITAHDGLEYPLPDVTFGEHGILDGGSYVATRTPTRLVAVSMTTTAHTRRELTAAFQPGVRLTLTSDLGSLPYYVEGLVFDSPNLRGPVRFTVTLHSPDAYPTVGYGAAMLGTSTAVEITAAGLEITSAGIAVETYAGVTAASVWNAGALTVEPRLTLTTASTGDLAITHPGGTFTVAVTAGDAVIIDSRARSVTIDGVSALSAFDRTSAWPILNPGTNNLTFSQAVVVGVGWADLGMGLL